MNKAFENILKKTKEKCKHSYITNHGKDYTEFDICTELNLCFNEIQRIVQEVAEEYKGGWIACSDRLPEECIEVLVSVKEIDGSFYTRTSWVQDGSWIIKKTPLQPTVIAWQPLPEPFKEREPD